MTHSDYPWLPDSVLDAAFARHGISVADAGDDLVDAPPGDDAAWCYTRSTGQTDGRACVYCDALIARRQGESTGHWRKRRSCNAACAARARAIGAGRPPVVGSTHAIPRMCSECGAPVVRRERESLDKWERRRTCAGPTCYRAAAVRSLARARAAKLARKAAAMERRRSGG